MKCPRCEEKSLTADSFCIGCGYYVEEKVKMLGVSNLTVIALFMILLIFSIVVVAVVLMQPKSQQTIPGQQTGTLYPAPAGTNMIVAKACPSVIDFINPFNSHCFLQTKQKQEVLIIDPQTGRVISRQIVDAIPPIAIQDPQQRIGLPCNSNVECGSTLICKNQGLLFGGGACQYKRTLGESCSKDNECIDGAYCEKALLIGYFTEGRCQRTTSSTIPSGIPIKPLCKACEWWNLICVSQIGAERLLGNCI